MAATRATAAGSELTRFLRRVVLRLRTVWALAEAQYWGPWVAGASVVLLAAAKLIEIVPSWVALVSPAVAVLALVVLLVTTRLTVADAAVVADRSLRTGEAISSALEHTDDPNPLVGRIRERAVAALDGSSARSVAPMAWYPSRLGAVGGLAVAAGLLLWWPGLVGSPLSPFEQELIADQVEEVEALAEAVARSEIAEEQKAELDAALDQLSRELAEAESLSDAEALVEELRTDLESQVSDGHLSEKAATQGLERELNRSPLDPGTADAASQLAGLAGELGGLTDGERRTLADRLDELADSQSEGSPEVSEALASAASALRSGDPARASDALRSAADRHRTASDQVRRDEVNRAVSSALGGPQARLRTGASGTLQSAQAGQPGEGRGRQPGQGQGGQGQGGQGQGAGQGEGSGQGEGQGQGGGGQGGQDGGSPGGAIAGVQPTGQEQSGQGGRGTVADAPVTDVDGMDVERATVYDPFPGGGRSNEIQVGIEGGTGDGAIIGRADTITERGQSIVPLQQVLPDYLDQATASLDDTDLPPATRDTVRRYFDGLAAEANQR